MKIILENNKPIVELPILLKNGNYGLQKFLVDTSFTGSVVFISQSDNKNNDIFDKFDFRNINEVSKNKWVNVADGRKAETISGMIFFKINDKVEFMSVLIIDALQDDIPVIGIEFLKRNENELMLNFKNNYFRLN